MYSKNIFKKKWQRKGFHEYEFVLGFIYAQTHSSPTYTLCYVNLPVQKCTHVHCTKC